MNPFLVMFAMGMLFPQAGTFPSRGASSGETSSESSAQSSLTPWAPSIPDRQQPDSPFPDPDTLEARGAEIGNIEVHCGDIFDREQPGETFRLYRWANRLHRKTRERVIERFLLLEEGAPYSRYEVEESARILRSQRYLYDATIEPVAYDGKRVDLRVKTRDVWTLKVGASLSRSGGENDFDLVLQDSNFLGTGKEITLKRSADVDRSGYQVRFYDPNLLATRAELELNYADNSDGQFQKLKLRRRFFSLDSRRAGGLEYVSNQRFDSIYDLAPSSGNSATMRPSSRLGPVSPRD